jgi:hypothetical protein
MNNMHFTQGLHVISIPHEREFILKMKRKSEEERELEIKREGL